MTPKKARRYFRAKPRRVLPVFVGQCPECGLIVRDLYGHLLSTHEGWQPL